jgi:putative ABC transport system permease protein
MNILQLVFKQMRQRALGTWLTLLSVVLGVALAVAVLLVREGGESVFGQRDYGYDLIVGKGSPLQLVLNTVYHIENSPGNIPYSLYEQLARNRQMVKQAIPIAVGDSYKTRRIIGTLPQMFGYTAEGTAVEPENAFQYRPGKRFEFTSGTAFHPRKFEAVIGSEVTQLTGLKLGDTFRPTHGGFDPGEKAHEHDEVSWKVVGVLKPTHTANDRVVFIPLVTTYCIEEHEKGMEVQGDIRAGRPVSQPSKEEHHEPFTMNPDGTVEPELPKDKWLVSAILVKARAPFYAQRLEYDINAGSVATAVNPAMVMSEFFKTILSGSTMLLLLISALVSIVAAVGILVSIYNSVAARKREIAILRALGATRGRVLALICLEAGLIGLLGGVGGWILGHLVGAGASLYMDRLLGQGFNWLAVGWEQAAYLLGVVVIAVLAGLVPALKAYGTPVATNLVAT